jgi:hypothetical protein
VVASGAPEAGFGGCRSLRESPRRAPTLLPTEAGRARLPALRLAGPLPGLARDRSAVARRVLAEIPQTARKPLCRGGVVPSQASFSHSVFPIVQTLGGGETFAAGLPAEPRDIGQQGPQTRREQQLLKWTALNVVSVWSRCSPG